VPDVVLVAAFDAGRPDAASVNVDERTREGPRASGYAE
jgi:hypothetical protein